MVLTIGLLTLVVILAYFSWRFSMEATAVRAKYAGITDIDNAVAAARREVEQSRQKQQTNEQEHQRALDAQLRAATEELEHVREQQRAAEQEHQRTLDAQLPAATEELDRVRRDQQAFLAAAQQVRAALNEEYQHAL